MGKEQHPIQPVRPATPATGAFPALPPTDSPRIGKEPEPRELSAKTASEAIKALGIPGLSLLTADDFNERDDKQQVVPSPLNRVNTFHGAPIGFGSVKYKIGNNEVWRTRRLVSSGAALPVTKEMRGTWPEMKEMPDSIFGENGYVIVGDALIVFGLAETMAAFRKKQHERSDARIDGLRPAKHREAHGIRGGVVESQPKDLATELAAAEAL
jgi:hypothetical protein